MGAKKKTIHGKEYHAIISMLRDLRENKNVTQKELADRIDSEQTFISKIETGERRLDIIELKNICEALGEDLVAFIIRYQEETKNI